MPNSPHSAPNDFSRRIAATTNCTRCSRTSIVFQGISVYTPALATLAPECKGCLGTLCKGCRGTEHKLGWVFLVGRRPPRRQIFDQLRVGRFTLRYLSVPVKAPTMAEIKIKPIRERNLE